MPDALTRSSQVGSLYIREYRVRGAHRLAAIEIENVVYPFLGPGRTPADVEEARAALEQVYRDKGYQTVVVQVPSQNGAGGVIFLQVTENTVGRLRVKGSRYFSSRQIKKETPSLAEGTVPNFNEVARDIVALNQLADRRVAPSLHAGVAPGTVDVDLEVQDTFPLHGSLEINNRYSPETTLLRLNGSISYNNLWQLGHAVGFSFQLAPQRLTDAKVFSGYYLARIPGVSGLTLLVQGTSQNSNVSTLGGAAVAGRGRIIGAQAIVSLPNGKDFFQNLAFGFGYKHFDQNIIVVGETLLTPITYYPFTINYTATWANKGSVTALSAGVTFAARGLGSDEAQFDFSRFNAGGNFIYLRGGIEHTHDLPMGLQVCGRVSGQVSDQPLVSSEQFSAGGLATVRGYLESEVLGDNAVLGSLELRSPSLLKGPAEKYELRLYLFAEGGTVLVDSPLPDQPSSFQLASIGVGGSVRLGNHFNGSLDLGLPFISQAQTDAWDPLLTFRVWADF
jgi:hemolysin activation/secretion protein